MGVTGARNQVNKELPNIISRIRKYTDVPLAVGFGVSTREQFQTVAQHSDGVVIGSQIITTLANARERLVSFRGEEYMRTATHTAS